MKAVGSAFARQDDRHRPGELRRRVVHLDLHLGDRIESRRARKVPPLISLVHCRAIEQRDTRVCTHTICLRDPGRIDARDRRQQTLVAAAVDRQLLNALPLQHVTERGRIDLNHRRDIFDIYLGDGLPER